MAKIVKSFLTRFGIDGAIAYTLLARGIQGGGGIVTLFFIARFLNIDEQGYYYTFGSILALQIFFELGLTGIITQFAAHEVAHLKWNNTTDLGGDITHLSRLASLLHFCVRWFSLMAVILFITLLITGYFFFDIYSDLNENISWKQPWGVLILASSLNLLATPLLAFFEGLGKIKKVAQLRFYQQLFSILSVWICLSSGLKLYVTGIAILVIFIIAIIWLKRPKQFDIIRSLWKKKNDLFVINWKTEILPYQWRIAISWISGYLSFQLFNPVLFATEGAEMAGKMGMTLVVLNGITSLTMSWINTKVPHLSGYIATKNYTCLDNLFLTTLKQALSVCLIALIIFCGGLYFLEYFKLNLASRFLPIPYILMLSIVTFVNQIVFFLATYLRCHKKEPLLVMSFVMGISTALSTIFLGKIWGISGIISGYTFLTLFMFFPWTVIIFRKKKKEWNI